MPGVVMDPPPIVIDFDDLLDTVRSLMESLTDRVRRAVDAILAWARRLPLEIATALVDLAREVSERFGSAVNEINVMITANLVRPQRIWLTAQEWDSVRDTLEGIIPGTSPTQLKTTGCWEGEARTAYAEVASAKHDQLDELLRRCEVGTPLRAATLAICAAWARFACLLVDIVAEAEVVVVRAATGVALPEAVGALGVLSLSLHAARTEFAAAIGVAGRGFMSALAHLDAGMGDEWAPVRTRHFDDLGGGRWRPTPPDSASV